VYDELPAYSQPYQWFYRISWMRTLVTIRAAFALVALTCAVLAGCSGQPSAQAGWPTQGSSNQTAAAAARSLLANTDNGLELRRWTVLDSPQRIRATLSKYIAGEAIDPQAHARIERNGFRFLRVAVDHIDALLEDIGGATVNATEWHGQVHQWRSLADRPVGMGRQANSDASGIGRAVAVDGKIGRYDRGTFRLLMRSWSVQMEDGPRIHLELLPQHQRPRANDLRRLIGESDNPITGFGGPALDLQLELGYAYVLLCDSPQAPWPADTATNAPAPSATRARFGPLETVGPGAAIPMTLGELLLSNHGKPPTRELLVFVPKIGADLFPPSEPADDGVDKQAQR
jgi:hypothetical protein